MRKSLRKWKEEEKLHEEIEPEVVPEKKKTKRKKKIERQPNILGGGLVVLSLIVLYLFIQYFSTHPLQTTSKPVEKVQAQAKEEADAQKRVSEEIDGYTKDIQEKINNFSILGVTIESKQAEKLERDARSLQEVPKKAAEGARNEILTTTIGEVINSVLRLRKIGEDIESLKRFTIEKAQELQ
jgi:hypothetical protein